MSSYCIISWGKPILDPLHVVHRLPPSKANVKPFWLVQILVHGQTLDLIHSSSV